MNTLETIGAASIVVFSVRTGYSIYITVAQHLSTRRQATKAGFDAECERSLKRCERHRALIGQGERRDFGALLWPFLLAFRPQQEILHPCGRSDMDDLLRKDFHIAAHKFYGRSLDQSELHYLRAGLRRRALVLMAAYLIQQGGQFFSPKYWKDRFAGKPVKPSSS